MLLACDLLPQMLTKGTTSLSRQEIEDRTTELKCDIGASGGKGYVTISVKGRKEFLKETLDLVIDILRNPAFPEEEFKLLKTGQIAQIEAQKSSPQMKAIVAMSKKLNPVESDSIHYALDMEEQIARMNATTIADVKRLYDDFLAGNQGELTAVGSIDADQIKNSVEEGLAGWKTDQAYQRVPEVHFDFTPEDVKIETPDKANAIMLMSTTMPIRSDDPDWEALFLANDILGGGSLSSRLGQRVREEKGLSYAVGSQFQADAQDYAASFMTYAITNPANRDALLTTVNEVFDEYLANGVTDEELEAAKISYAKSIEDMLGSDQKLTGVLHQYQNYDRDEAYLRGRLDRMAGVTKEQVNSAARRLLNEKKFITITAGDFENANPEDAVKEK